MEAQRRIDAAEARANSAERDLLGAQQAAKPPGPPTVTPAPPSRGMAAARVGPGLARPSASQGRASTILAPRGTLVDQVKSLLGG